MNISLVLRRKPDISQYFKERKKARGVANRCKIYRHEDVEHGQADVQCEENTQVADHQSNLVPVKLLL